MTKGLSATESLISPCAKAALQNASSACKMKDPQAKRLDKKGSSAELAFVFSPLFKQGQWR
jgi:hypothetical protein